MPTKRAFASWFMKGRGEIKEVRIRRTQLDAAVLAALELMPCECIGIVFGRSDVPKIMIEHIHAMQRVSFRDPFSVRHSGFVLRRLIETQRSLWGHDAIGTLHSHTHIMPDVPQERIEECVRLSEDDVGILANSDWGEVALLVSCFALQAWNPTISGGSTPWESLPLRNSATGAKQEIQVLSRIIGINMYPDELSLEFRRAIHEEDGRMLQIEQEVLDLEEREITKEARQFYREEIGFHESYRESLNEQGKALESIRMITGFQVVASVHIRAGGSFIPGSIRPED